jgi:hypothetical protein
MGCTFDLALVALRKAQYRVAAHKGRAPHARQ